MTFVDLELHVIQWAEARKIIPNSTPEAQYMKAISEMGELADALLKKNPNDIKDAIGDTVVCFINMCALLDINLTDCLEVAYLQIKNRKGSLLPNGVFVKQ
jgi:hypothetical protein